jgi:hypothetical protein
MKPLTIFGLIIFSIGGLLLIGFGLVKFFEDTSMPPVIRWGVLGLILGAMIILISLIIERIYDSN